MVEVAALILAGAAVGTGVAQGEQARRAQKKSLRQQEETQRQSLAAAVNDKQLSDMQERRASQQAPDVNSLLASASTPKQSSLLTGPGGVDPSKLILGKTKLLGE